MIELSKAQKEAIVKISEDYQCCLKELVLSLSPLLFCDGAVQVLSPNANIWLCIETDGHTHS